MLAFALALLLAAGPTPAARPAVTGTLQQGATLTATAGTWAGTGSITYAFQWYRCDRLGAHCTSVRGATRATYTEVAADVGKTIGLTVRATDATGTTPAYAPLAGLVAPLHALAATEQPRLAGAAVVGQTLQVAAAAATAWLRCNANGRVCVRVAGGSSYPVVTDDVGHVIVAAVTIARQTVLSLPSEVVRTAPGPVATGASMVAGVARVGKRLTATAGAWSGSGTIAYGYQWYRCDERGAHCATIRGATAQGYAEVAADAGKTIALTVHATDTAGTAAAYGSLVGPVAAASSPLASTVQPGLAGTAAVGQTLEATDSSWSTKPASLAYAWLRCNPNGRLCAPIAGATAPSYLVSAADRGHTIVAALDATAGTATQAALTVASTVVP